MANPLDALGKVGKAALNFVPDIVQGTSEAQQNIAQGFKDKGLLGGIGNAVSEAPNLLGDMVSSIGETATPIGQTMAAPIVATGKTVAGADAGTWGKALGLFGAVAGAAGLAYKVKTGGMSSLLQDEGQVQFNFPRWKAAQQAVQADADVGMQFLPAARDGAEFMNQHLAASWHGKGFISQMVETNPRIADPVVAESVLSNWGNMIAQHPYWAEDFAQAGNKQDFIESVVAQDLDKFWNAKDGLLHGDFMERTKDLFDKAFDGGKLDEQEQLELVHGLSAFSEATVDIHHPRFATYTPNVRFSGLEIDPKTGSSTMRFSVLPTAPDIEKSFAALEPGEFLVQRYDVSPTLGDRSNGIYFAAVTDPKNFRSDFSAWGDHSHWGIAKPKNILDLPGDNSYESAGRAALTHFGIDYDRLEEMAADAWMSDAHRQQIVRKFSELAPNVDWDGIVSEVGGRSMGPATIGENLIDSLGAAMARDRGYDAILHRSVTGDPGMGAGYQELAVLDQSIMRKGELPLLDEHAATKNLATIAGSPADVPPDARNISALNSTARPLRHELFQVSVDSSGKSMLFSNNSALEPQWSRQVYPSAFNQEFKHVALPREPVRVMSHAPATSGEMPSGAVFFHPVEDQLAWNKPGYHLAISVPSGNSKALNAFMGSVDALESKYTEHSMSGQPMARIDLSFARADDVKKAAAEFESLRGDLGVEGHGIVAYVNGHAEAPAGYAPVYERHTLDQAGVRRVSYSRKGDPTDPGTIRAFAPPEWIVKSVDEVKPDEFAQTVRGKQVLANMVTIEDIGKEVKVPSGATSIRDVRVIHAGGPSPVTEFSVDSESNKLWLDKGWDDAADEAPQAKPGSVYEVQDHGHETVVYVETDQDGGVIDPLVVNHAKTMVSRLGLSDKIRWVGIDPSTGRRINE